VERDQLQQLLKTSTVRITFEKVNGEKRVMNCTLQEQLLPDQIDLEEVISEKRINLETLAVWDLDKKDWRSFRLDKILDIETL
jgi:esterase/lipase superfamily enzyme